MSVPMSVPMEVPPTDKEKAIDWLNKHETHFGNSCPHCGATTWGVFDQLYELRQFAQGQLSVQGTVIPLVVVICNTCGYTRLFNAISMGIVKVPEAGGEPNAK